MKIMKYTITFYSFWRIGTGLGSGSIDSVLMKDDDNLPIIPGKTLKGLIRDAYYECNLPNGKELFGHELPEKADKHKKSDLQEGKLYFGTAHLPDDEANYLKNNTELIKGLYRNITTTRLDQNKQNVDTALVKSEVCIPLTLEAEITPVNEETITDKNVEELEKAFKMLKLMGEKRYRGLGRCIVKLDKNKQS